MRIVVVVLIIVVAIIIFAVAFKKEDPNVTKMDIKPPKGGNSMKTKIYKGKK